MRANHHGPRPGHDPPRCFNVTGIRSRIKKHGCSAHIIVAKVAELGLSLSELSLSVGKNHAYFQQFIKRGVPARLPEEVRGRVAESEDRRADLEARAAKPSPAAPGANAHAAARCESPLDLGLRAGRGWQGR